MQTLALLLLLNPGGSLAILRLRPCRSRSGILLSIDTMRARWYQTDGDLHGHEKAIMVFPN